MRASSFRERNNIRNSVTASCCRQTRFAAFKGHRYVKGRALSANADIFVEVRRIVGTTKMAQADVPFHGQVGVYRQGNPEAQRG